MERRWTEPSMVRGGEKDSSRSQNLDRNLLCLSAIPEGYDRRRRIYLPKSHAPQRKRVPGPQTWTGPADGDAAPMPVDSSLDSNCRGTTAFNSTPAFVRCLPNPFASRCPIKPSWGLCCHGSGHPWPLQDAVDSHSRVVRDDGPYPEGFSPSSR